MVETEVIKAKLISLKNTLSRDKNLQKTLIASVFLFLALLAFFLIPNGNDGAKTPEESPKVAGSSQFGTHKRIIQESEISAKEGGIFESQDGYIKVIFPANFTAEDVKISYKSVNDSLAYAKDRVGPMYELKATTDDGTDITKFDKHITIQTNLKDGDLNEYKTEYAGTYFYNVENKKWENLDSTILGEENQIVALTNHFTTFTSTTNDPNASSTSSSTTPDSTGIVIDDSDPEPFFEWEDFGDSDQPAYRDIIFSGLNGGATITGNSINSSKHNSGTWNADGITGTLPVSVSIPTVNYCTVGGSCAPLTTGATYKITHAGGVDTVTVNQFESQGGVVELGTYEFNGSGSVELTDVVAERGDYFLSFVVFDAVFFGEVTANLDVTPPLIENVKAMTSNGKFCIEAKVTDEGSGVAEVVLFLNRGGSIQEYTMNASGDIYSVCVGGIKQGESITYEIGAIDNASNESFWNWQRGYVARGSFGRFLGYHPGMVHARKSVGYAKNYCYDCTIGQYTADPVNTVNGNLIDEQRILMVNARPDIDLTLTYNSQGGRIGIFGESWTHAYNYHLIEMDNADYTGVYVQYPSGFIAEFAGSGYEPEPGVFEKLTKTGDGYELLFKDLTKVTFDADGEILRWEDSNGNGLNFSYAEKFPYTTLSQISKITSDGGREVSFEYNDKGLVQKINAPESVSITFEYNDTDDLTAITDARNKVTRFEYNDHNLTKKISPKGHAYYENVFDDERRVVEQFAGNDFDNKFSYSANEVTKTNAYGKTSIYKYNSDKLLEELIDQNGKALKYKFDADKNVIEFTDRDGNKYSYTYDSNGNKVNEKDPLGYEIKTNFDTSFNKPVNEVNKIADHVTDWSYDPLGNLTKVKNAKSDEAKFTYNSYGLIETATDFNGNTTKYEYNSNGDLIKITDPLNNSESYDYDGLGRMIKYTNARGFSYTYVYDGNDNVLEINGPLGYKLQFSYDDNNHQITATDANGGVSKYSYDESENETSEKNQLDFLIDSTHGKMNELLQQADKEGRITNYEYDAAFNPIKVTMALGTSDEATTEFAYNGMRKITQVTDAEGRVSRYEYDPLQRLIKQTLNVTPNPADSENNVKTEFIYSATGMLLKEIDANGNATNYTYDQLDQLIKVVDAEGNETKYGYDRQGNKISMINPRGYETKYSYDANNRLITEKDALNGEFKYGYDQNGNIISETDDNGVVTAFVYNELDRVVTKYENFIHAQSSTADRNVITRYEYDLHGNLTRVVNPRGFETKFVYDAAHRNIQIIDALGNSYKYSYDKVDNLTKIVDRNNHSQLYAYDNLDRIVKYTNQEGHFDTFSYDKVGNELEYVNARSKTYTKVYDPLNRLKNVQDPMSNFQKYSYDAMGNMLSLIDENGHEDKFAYDKIYRLTTYTDAEGFKTKYEYDRNSNVAKVIDGNTNPTNYKYDELDRLVEQINAENENTKYAYDKLENKTLEIEADGTKHTYTYDPLYRLVNVINNYKGSVTANNDTNVSTSYAYDPNGNLIATTNPLGNITQFEYDPLDRLQKEINPLANTWIYGYDAEGNRTSRLDANGDTTNYQYYPDNILSKIAYPTYEVNYKYNETNFPVQMVDNLGNTSWSYDDIDRVIGQIDPFSKILRYEYDGVGNLTKLTYPDNRFVAHNYLKNDWLKKSASSDSDNLSFTRDGVGNTTRIDRSNSTYSTINYDKVYRPLKSLDMQVDRGNHLIDQFDYVYNDVGDITKEVATYGWRQPAKVTTDFSYDGMHRLVKATDTDANNSVYSYDAAGNRLVLKETLKQGVETRSYNYNAANQLLGINIQSPKAPNVVDYAFKYDANGNRIDELIKDGTGVDRGIRYSYDVENRLTIHQEYQGQIVKNTKNNSPISYPESYVESLSTDEYQINDLAKNILEYDGNGRRLVKTYYPGASSSSGQEEKGRTEYVFDRLDPVVEYNIQNGQRKNLYRDSAQNLMFYQEFKSEQAPNGTIYFYHFDGEGNVSATTKHGGQSDHTYRLDEYGMPLPTVGTDKNQNNGGAWVAPHNEYVTSQKEFDSNMDLYYFGARHYDPLTGTWISQDSYRGEIQNPMSLHRYMYNYDSPINYVDWYGFSACNSTSSVYCYGLQNSSQPPTPGVNYTAGPTSTQTNTSNTASTSVDPTNLSCNPGEFYSQLYSFDSIIFGTTFSQAKAGIMGGPGPYPTRITMINGRPFLEYTEFHHRFIPQRNTLFPDTIKNSRFNLKQTWTLEHAKMDPYRKQFLPKWVKEGVNWSAVGEAASHSTILNILMNMPLMLFVVPEGGYSCYMYPYSPSMPCTNKDGEPLVS